MRTKWFAIAWPTKRGGLADPLLRASSEHFPKCAMREHGGLAGPPRRLRHSQAEAIFSDCRAHPLQYESNGSPVQREAREQKTTRHLLDNHLFVNSISRSNFSIAPPLSITFPASSYPS